MTSQVSTRSKVDSPETFWAGGNSSKNEDVDLYGIQEIHEYSGSPNPEENGVNHSNTLNPEEAKINQITQKRFSSTEDIQNFSEESIRAKTGSSPANIGNPTNQTLNPEQLEENDKESAYTNMPHQLNSPMEEKSSNQIEIVSAIDTNFTSSNRENSNQTKGSNDISSNPGSIREEKQPSSNQNLSNKELFAPSFKVKEWVCC